uniref:Phosphatidylinositol 3-kinase catalytic subunit type 3 n=1 Tax=Dugesia japonica TaxID=6161 RepID=A0A6C0SN29_DUGJA|nr:phosphatidylinositol-4,5-bisphosphate 3-kinase tpye 3 [Dugesia japonica]
MSKISVNFYKSCSINQEIRGTVVKPFFKIMSLHGFDPDFYKIMNNCYNPLNAFSEPKIYYIVSKSQNFLKEIPCLNNWNVNNNIPIDGKIFNEEVELNIPYCELTEYCQILFVLASYFIIPNGAVEEKYLNAGYLTLFNSHDVFRRGIYEIELHPLDHDNYTSLEEILNKVIHMKEFNGKPTSIPELNMLQKTMRKKLRGQLSCIPMEKITLSKVEQRINELKNQSKKIFLSVEFRFSKDIQISLPVVLIRPTLHADISRKFSSKNPVEKKHYLMTRNARAINTDRNRRPDNEDLAEIKKILKQPPNTIMTEAESDLIWKYRYHISVMSPTALSKVMRSVQWDYQSFTDQVNDILLKWPDLNPEHLMELLTSHFLNPVVRKFAVKRLNMATDDDLFLYLFQLVQALRYDIFEEIFNVEPGDEKHYVEHDNSLNDLKTLPNNLDHSMFSLNNQKSFLASFSSNIINLQEDLATFLIRRCKSNRKLSTYFYWYLTLEFDEDNSGPNDVKSMFRHVHTRFKLAMDYGDIDARENSANINSQINFVNDLTQLIKNISTKNIRAQQKSEFLKSELLSNKYPYITNIDPKFYFPLKDDFLVDRIDINSCSVLKSALAPVKLALLSDKNMKYDVMFKVGDDLRQDQVVLQMINFMDEILRRENFDLKLTPYKVLATSKNSGFIEFVKSKSISEILNDNTTILNYFRKVAFSEKDPQQVDPIVMDNYIRSLAGYCVITYLLGVGDRHLDNIMLTETGLLFHIDFGFVLGNDPKPLPPEVRLTKDMIDVMGGANDLLFNSFCDLAFNTFNYLRRHANQCLSLLSLITDAGIQDFSREPDKACEFVKERFLLDFTEEQAIHRLAERLTASVKAIFPDMMEKLHKFAMRFK